MAWSSLSLHGSGSASDEEALPKERASQTKPHTSVVAWRSWHGYLGAEVATSQGADAASCGATTRGESDRPANDPDRPSADDGAPPEEPRDAGDAKPSSADAGVVPGEGSLQNSSNLSMEDSSDVSVSSESGDISSSLSSEKTELQKRLVRLHGVGKTEVRPTEVSTANSAGANPAGVENLVNGQVQGGRAFAAPEQPPELNLSPEAWQELLRQIPPDESGLASSVGSIGHARGECRSPCVLLYSKYGCKRGLACENCHLVHGQKPQSRLGSMRDRFQESVATAHRSAPHRGGN